MYLLIKNGFTTEHETLLDVAQCFDIAVSNHGEVTVDDIKDTISYNPKEWTKEEIIADFVIYRLSRVMRNCKLYKAKLL